MKRVAIIGPGAMGILFAYLLNSVFEEIFLVDYVPGRAELIRKRGIRVEFKDGVREQAVKISAEPDKLGEMDLVLVCVKAYATGSAMERAIRLVGKDSMVLSLQNGLGNLEAIERLVPRELVLGGTTAMGANLIEPGYVRFAGEGEAVIGELGGGIEKAELVSEKFKQGGLLVKTTDRLMDTIWSKLVINVGINALTALLRVRNGRLLNYEGSKILMAELVSEAMEVVRAKGVELLYSDALRRVEEVAMRTGENISSMLQDVRARRRTEIDAINGAIVREGERLGIKTPLNRALTLLVQAIEASYSEQLN